MGNGSAAAEDALRYYDDNGNGSVNCAKVRGKEIASVERGHAGLWSIPEGDKLGSEA